MRKLHLLLTLFFALISLSFHGQSIDTEFGKNRVQYHDDFNKWWMYETANFITYWYGKGRNIGQSVVQIAEFYHDEIQNLAEHTINDKIEIIVYTDLHDLLQSNIGTEEIFETNADETKVIGSKIFVYFNGDHRHLKSQIREGIAQVFINSMFSKSSLQEIITSSADLIIPEWFGKGFTNYANAGWDNQIDDELREIWLRKKAKYHTFKKLLAHHPRVAGHSFWHFLYDSYGENIITTLIYLMRLSGDVDDSFLFILGKNFRAMQVEWSIFFEKKYSVEKGKMQEISDKTLLNLGFKNYFPKSTFKLSPNGKNLAYVLNNIGKYVLVIHDVEEGKKRNILITKGAKNAVQETDYNYPLITWHNDRELSTIFELRDKIYLRKYSVDTRSYIEQDLPENIQRVFSIDCIDEENYLFTALIDGYSDIIEYNTRYRGIERVTEDYHDDLHASFVRLGTQSGILFSSNRIDSKLANERLDTILPLNDFDVYFLPRTDDGYASSAINLTPESNQNDLQPLLANDHFITFLNEESGIFNRYLIDINTNRIYANSNYEHNIINHEASPYSDTYVYQVYHDAAYQLHLERPNWNARVNPFSTPNNRAAKIQIQQRDVTEKDTPQELSPERKFNSPFPDPARIEPLYQKNRYSFGSIITEKETDEEGKVIKFYSSRAVASRRKFKLEKIETRVDNDVLFDGLESYTDDGREFDGQEPGILVKATTKDLFEDYEIVAGIRIPVSFNGSEVFVTFDDKRKLIDRRYAIYRRTERETLQFNTSPEQKERFTSLIGLYRLSYPFSAYRSLRGTTQLRVDKNFFLNSDFPSSSVPTAKEQRISFKFEYVFDNTLPIDINLRHGTRYKAFLEFINRFDLSLDNGFDLEFSRGFTTIVGFDARHYVPVLRHSVLALRAAGAMSFGNSRMLYFIGDTDGSFSQSFNDAIPIPGDRNFSFMAHAPHLRGFDRNIRNGNSFTVVNTEFRMPILKYFSKGKIRSSFLRNIQVIGFFDLGSAWYGLFPGGSDNPINTLTIDDTPGIIIRIDVERKPWVFGYGVGGRLSFLGYFVRADYAWGNEDGFIQSPKLHISMGLDF